jgi:hypothetical protein
MRPTEDGRLLIGRLQMAARFSRAEKVGKGGEEVKTTNATSNQRVQKGDSMKRRILSLAIIFGLTIAVPTFAQVGQGLSGPHYNLNIIGVPKDKTVPDMTGSNRHVIFVPLQSGGDVSRQVKIQYIAGDEFRVIDGNATDDNLAIIEVPSSDGLADPCYSVYAVGLGTPHGNAIVNAECAFSEPLVGGGTCTDALLLDTFSINRTNGGSNKPRRVDITDIFRATGCLDLDDSGTCNTGDLQFSNVWVFNIPQLLSYMWDYDNNGLKLMQVRFYLSEDCGSIGTVN